MASRQPWVSRWALLDPSRYLILTLSVCVVLSFCLTETSYNGHPGNVVGGLAHSFISYGFEGASHFFGWPFAVLFLWLVICIVSVILFALFRRRWGALFANGVLLLTWVYIYAYVHLHLYRGVLDADHYLRSSVFFLAASAILAGVCLFGRTSRKA